VPFAAGAHPITQSHLIRTQPTAACRITLNECAGIFQHSGLRVMNNYHQLARKGKNSYAKARHCWCETTKTRKSSNFLPTALGRFTASTATAFSVLTKAYSCRSLVCSRCSPDQSKKIFSRLARNGSASRKSCGRRCGEGQESLQAPWPGLPRLC
jgi:hypothetical protein